MDAETYKKRLAEANKEILDGRLYKLECWAGNGYILNEADRDRYLKTGKLPKPKTASEPKSTWTESGLIT
jgi:hypothetical protein